VTDQPRALRRRPRHPAQMIAALFAGGVMLGTIVLMLPIARSGPGGSGFMEALFTATSALCVTGLSTVDVPVYWSGFGEVAILVMIQVGGFGIMTLASLLGLLVTRRLGLRSRINAAGESNTIRIGDVREILLGIMRITLVIELAVAMLLSARFFIRYDESLPRAAYLGVFHSVSAFNNAGFALYSDSLISFVGDPWICMPINIAVILGGIGFPVLLELRRRINRHLFSLHAKITLIGSGVLLVVGFVAFLALEWRNPATLGALDTPGKFLAAFTGSVQPRTAGFNSLDYGQMREPTLFVTTILMFIGGGSASTAGGIKVTTFFLLLYVIVAEVRGTRDVEMGDRRLGDRVQRQALTVALLAIGLVALSSMVLMTTESLSLNLALFEAVSAFGTVGLTAGVTPGVGVSGQLVLIALMFVGRVGPVTLVSALALRERPNLYRLPEGRPLIG
jgi:trk system potassium uptake protein